MKGVIEEKVSTTQADACEQRVMKIPPGCRYDLADKSASRAIIEPRTARAGQSFWPAEAGLRRPTGPTLRFG